MKTALTKIFIAIGVLALQSFSQTAPDGPGADAEWLSAAKQGVGTSASTESKVWFTLANGGLTEVMYPNISTANVQLLQFFVFNRRTKQIETEWDAAHMIESLPTARSEKILHLPHNTSVANVSISDIFRHVSSGSSLVFKQVNQSKTGSWRIEKTYLADPKNNTVVFRLIFSSPDPADELYVYFDPSMANSGVYDTGRVQGRALIASEKDAVAALTCGRCTFDQASAGFSGVNDALTQLRNTGTVSQPFASAENGNVLLTAKVLPHGIGKRTQPMVFALGFGKTGDEAVAAANSSLARGFDTVYRDYQSGWIDYLKTVRQVGAKYQTQFNMAAMVIKALEDKTVPGANVASLTVPWGGGGNANTGGNGYRMIWSRDLYHVFTAFMALGDKAAAMRSLDFLFNIQQKADGSFPQNSWLDGKQGWGSLQMDEVGYPLIMAWQLERFDKLTYQNHVKPAADFIVTNGPFTPQERWEERPGYSPSTIAAEIAGLVCAADIAKRNGDEASAMIWLAAADDWARSVERWTATTKGKYGDGNYFIRISEKGEPDGGHNIELNNNGGTFLETDIVDAGFLDLVRLGIKPADDPLIVKSLKVIDDVIRTQTPNGPAFYRYNHDGYGEMDDGRRWNWDRKYTGKGRPWPLLSGERGEYEIAECGTRNAKSNEQCLMRAQSRLDNMQGFANQGLMLPEQVWDSKNSPNGTDRLFVPELKFGKGTGSATPLAWSMAQFIRLAANLKAGRNLETPQIVYDRYKNGIPSKVANFGGLDEVAIIPLKPGMTVPADRQAGAGTRVAFSINGKVQVSSAGDDGKAKISFTMPAEPSVALVGVQAPDGATSFERVKILGAPPEQKFSPEMIDKMRTSKTSPIVDGDSVIFFYSGNANVVQIAGDMTGWNPGRIYMQKIGDDLFAYQPRFPRDARAEYKYLVNGKWELDPLNANRMDNGVGGENNVFAMPGYKPARITPPSAHLDEFDIVSKTFGTRKIKVYLPSTYAGSAERFGAIYLQDGSEYASRAGAPSVLEDLLRAGKVKPFILVLIDPKDRMKEYWANDQWADLIANEVVPEIDRRYRTIANRDGRALLGASLGGITSLHVGLRHPDKFSRLGGQSSSFWVDNERVVKELEKLDAAKAKFKFYLDDGTFESVEDSRRVNVMLRGKGFPVTYIEGSTGHNWTAWRDRLADAFIALMN